MINVSIFLYKIISRNTNSNITKVRNTANKLVTSKMTSLHANVNVFNMDLLLSTITNTDTLVRSYKNACTENNQLKKNLQSITDSSVQLTSMYQKEREKTIQLTAEKHRLDAKIKEIEQQIVEIANKKLNQETIHKQMIAELEEQVGKSSDAKQSDYIDLCKQFVAQGNLLQQNNLATAALRRKHKHVIDILKQRGEKYEEPLNTSIKRSSSVGTKTMENRSIATMTETLNQPICQAEKIAVKTCERATMHRVSTATRSTCTSVFIKRVDASTSTESIDQSNKNVRNIFKETLTHPALLSPIKSVGSTQANKTDGRLQKKSVCDQGTITQLENVCREIGYMRNVYSPHSDQNSVDSGFASPINTKNEFSDLFMNQNLFSASAMNASVINPELLRVWQMLGETVFSIVGTGRIFNDHAPSFMHNPTFSRASSTSRSIEEPFSKLQEELLKFKSMSQVEPELCVDSEDIENSRSMPDKKLIELECQAGKLPERKRRATNLDEIRLLPECRGLSKSKKIEEKINVQNDILPSKTFSSSRKLQTREKQTKRANKYDELFGSAKRIRLQQKVNFNELLNCFAC